MLKKVIVAGVVAATATLGIAGIANADTGTSTHSSSDDNSDSSSSDDNSDSSSSDSDS